MNNKIFISLKRSNLWNIFLNCHFSVSTSGLLFFLFSTILLECNIATRKMFSTIDFEEYWENTQYKKRYFYFLKEKELKNLNLKILSYYLKSDKDFYFVCYILNSSFKTHKIVIADLSELHIKNEKTGGVLSFPVGYELKSNYAFLLYPYQLISFRSKIKNLEITRTPLFGFFIKRKSQFYTISKIYYPHGLLYFYLLKDAVKRESIEKLFTKLPNKYFFILSEFSGVVTIREPVVKSGKNFNIVFYWSPKLLIKKYGLDTTYNKLTNFLEFRLKKSDISKFSEHERVITEKDNIKKVLKVLDTSKEIDSLKLILKVPNSLFLIKDYKVDSLIEVILFPVNKKFYLSTPYFIVTPSINIGFLNLSIAALLILGIAFLGLLYLINKYKKITGTEL